MKLKDHQINVLFKFPSSYINKRKTTRFSFLRHTKKERKTTKITVVSQEPSVPLKKKKRGWNLSIQNTKLSSCDPIMGLACIPLFVSQATNAWQTTFCKNKHFLITKFHICMITAVLYICQFIRRCQTKHTFLVLLSV